MKRKMFLPLAALVLILICFPIEVYSFRDLTRKEAERLCLAAYPGIASNTPCYIFLIIGKWDWGSTPTPEKDVYIKLQQLGLVNFSEEKSIIGEFRTLNYKYRSEVTEKGKSEITEVPKEIMKSLKLPDLNEKKWYAIRIFNLKFAGCTGIRNFIEKKEAIADFGYEFADRTKTFSAISHELKEFLSKSVYIDGSQFMKIFLKHDWVRKAIDDPNFKGTFSVTFDLYDDGWRLRQR